MRVLESERAARRAGVLQVVTLHSVASMGLLSLGAQLALTEHAVAGGLLMAGAGVFAGLVLYGMRRIQNLDQFEKGLRR